MIDSVMPAGVEHLNPPASSVASSSVIDSVMPAGVEHQRPVANHRGDVYE